MSIQIGVSNAASNVSDIYIGVSNVPRRVVEAYVGVNGAPRKFYEADTLLSSLAEGSTIPSMRMVVGLNS